MDNMKFWDDRFFHFQELLGENPYFYKKSASFIKTLLDDTHLVRCLQSKAHWEFTDIQSFNVVLSRIPSFRHTALTIGFDCSCDTIQVDPSISLRNATTTKLGAWQHLTTLDISD